MPRGTASVVGYAAIALKHLDPNAVMAVLTADHLIRDVEKYQGLLDAAYRAAKDDYLVTIGIEPTHASTGYGYIQQGELLGKYNEFEAYRALRFKEKPDQARAQTMIDSQDHVWNSGMFFWGVRQITKEFERQMPVLFKSLDYISSAWESGEKEAVIDEIWPAIVPETIDYGIMENAEKVLVLPARDLGWNDIGSWDALYDVLNGDDDGNIVVSGETLPFKSKNVLTYGANLDKLIVSIGVDDLIVVDLPDVLLICKREDAQSVREIVKKLKSEKSNLI
jgi:mannose-1-phosphate guanylyltransferase